MNWLQRDAQSAIHNLGASTQHFGGYVAHLTGSFQCTYAPLPVYVPQSMYVPQQPIYPPPCAQPHNRMP